MIAATEAPVLTRDEARSGAVDEAGFELFYRLHARPLLGYLTRLCGDPSLAEDLLQRSFLQYLTSPPRESSDAQQRAWLYRIATNALTDHWRHAKLEKGQPLPEAMQVGSAAGIDIARDFQRVLGRLSPQERALLWFAHVEEASHRDIASTVGVKESSVKVLLFRARKKLAGMLEQIGFTAGDYR